MKKRIHTVFPWFVLACALICSAAFFACFGMHNLDADLSSEMILADLQNQEGTLLSDQWLYSTELRIISAVPFYQLGLLLFDSWHAARTFSVILMMLLTVASFLFLARQVGLKKSAPWFAALLCLPLNQTYAYISLYGGFYTMHVILSFLILGLICRYADTGLRHGKRVLGVLVLLSLWSGLGGVRMMLMLFAPLFFALLLQVSFELYHHASLREIAHHKATRIGLSASVAFLVSCIGYLINTTVFPGRFRFLSYSQMNLAPFKLEDFLGQLDRIAIFFGFSHSVPFFSDRGLTSLIALLLFALAVIASVCLFRRYSSLTTQQQFLLLTMLTALLLGILVNMLLQQYLVRYYLVALLLLIMMLALAWETSACKNQLLRSAALLAVMGMFAMTTQDTLRFHYQQGIANYEMAAQWLLERGYTQGYATFWNANTIAEASNGEIEMWVLEDGRYEKWMELQLHSILEKKEHYTCKPEGKVFLLVDEIQNQVDAPLLSKDHLIGEQVGWSYFIYGYESVEEMQALVDQGK